MPLPPTPYPVCHIEFDGQAVYSGDIRSVDLVTNVSWQADQLTVVLDNSRRLSDFIRKEHRVECWLGYAADPYVWDKSELVHVFSGAADGIVPKWGVDTTLTVSCRDHTRELIDSQADPGWSYMSLADAGIVTLLAKRAGLTPKVSASMVPISEQEVTSFLGTPQGANPGEPFVGASGWDIVQTLAVRNGFAAYVTVDKVLYWGPRNDAAGVPIIGGILAAAASLGTWTYLEEPFDLLGVTFDDSALVVNKVTVVRWLGLDQVQPDGFVSGFAVDAGRLQAARGRVIEKTVASTTAASVQDCGLEAAALLKKLARPAITAQATVEGDPRLVGDAKLTLAGAVLGRFAADYYVEAAKHHFGTDGYTCELQLTSVRPEASEAYRSALNVGQGQDQALAPDAPGVAGTVPTCGDAPIDYAAAWPEGGAAVDRLLQDNGIDVHADDATCGPIAAAGMLKAFGITTDPGKLAKRGEQGDSKGAWWTPGGMGGLDTEVKLVQSQGLTVHSVTSGWQAEAIKRASACQPVILETDGGSHGHYYLASAYRAADSRFLVGVTGFPALKRGKDWMTIAEMSSAGVGSLVAIIVADAPQPMKAGANQAVDPTGLPSFQSTGNGDPQRMVDNLKPLAYAWEKQSGIPATILLAINASESNWGNTEGNSIFGMGAHGNHTSQVMASPGGRHAEIPGTQRLATYPDANGAYQDFVDVVTHGRYANAYARLKAGGTGLQFVADLQSAGYAEDVDWAEKIATRERQVKALL